MGKPLSSQKAANRLPIYFAGGILTISVILFAVLFLLLSDNPTGISDEDLTSDTYMDIVESLLINADAARGEILVESYGCNVCHSDESNIPAPKHSDVVSVAAERRPPLTAAAYIYESIVYPGAYVVDEYNDIMARTYGDEIPDADLGDIIAYLLAEKSEF